MRFSIIIQVFAITVLAAPIAESNDRTLSVARDAQRHRPPGSRSVGRDAQRDRPPVSNGDVDVVDEIETSTKRTNRDTKRDPDIVHEGGGRTIIVGEKITPAQDTGKTSTKREPDNIHGGGGRTIIVGGEVTPTEHTGGNSKKREPSFVSNNGGANGNAVYGDNHTGHQHGE